jgi:16S rRNA pseudouridine516 synthase
MARIDDLLARNLGTSKSAVGRLLEAGRVTTVAGDLVTDRKADSATLPGSAGDLPSVLVDGERVDLFEAALVLLNKPAGVVTALRDARHATAFSLVQDAPLASLLRPVGRLDLDTTGLLLWTTDGALIQRLTHPKRRVARVYQAALAEPFGTLPADLTLEDGYRPDIEALSELAREAAHPALEIPPDTRTLATITVVGGAYHEVRRIFAALGSHVVGLCRVRFGPFELPADLPAGQWRSLPVPVTA